MRIGIIGGSGLEDPVIFQKTREKEFTTPYGSPSSPLTFGTIDGKEIVLLSRHGTKH